MGASDKKVAEAVQQAPANYFAELAGINVGEHMEKKGQFSYLSWAWAVAELRKRHQDATWEVLRFDGVPYLKTELGYFVEVAVTVKGVTLSQIHPVLDNSNRPIQKPNPFQINTSIQRALVKAIALHGLGLYIYAGEDLPDVEGHDAPPADIISDDQWDNLVALMKETNTDPAKFAAFLKVASLEYLLVSDYDRAIRALKSKRNVSQKAAAKAAAQEAQNG